MVEVYVGTAEEIELRVYAGGTRTDSAAPVTATLYDAAGEVVSTGPAEVIAAVDSGESHEYYTYLIELTETASEAEYTLVWSYEPTLNVEASRTDVIKVIKPYCYPDQVREEFPVLADRSYNELKHLERVVRYTINSFCGQEFGFQPAYSRQVFGGGSASLWLPKRLQALSSVHAYTGVSEGTYSISQYVMLRDSGWNVTFKNAQPGIIDIKADLGTGYNRIGKFHSGQRYSITGDWGWTHVPGEVEQASSILIGRYTEPEQNWRRYNVDVIRANDWRMEFSHRSSETTGDADVDIMLQSYKAPSYGVI